MRPLVLALAAGLATMTIPLPAAQAEPDLTKLPACLGHSWCYESTGNGWAVFCIQSKSTWMCGECESCGNGPFRDPIVLP